MQARTLHEQRGFKGILKAEKPNKDGNTGAGPLQLFYLWPGGESSRSLSGNRRLHNSSLSTKDYSPPQPPSFEHQRATAGLTPPPAGRRLAVKWSAGKLTRRQTRRFTRTHVSDTRLKQRATYAKLNQSEAAAARRRGFHAP